jgi:hypothetical protein
MRQAPGPLLPLGTPSPERSLRISPGTAVSDVARTCTPFNVPSVPGSIAPEPFVSQ